MGVLCPLQGFYTSTGHPCGSTRRAGLAVPRCPLAPRVLAEAEAGMAAGREAPLFQACSFVCWSRSTAASLPGQAGPEGSEHTGSTGDQGWRVVLPVPSSRCPWPRGAAASPDGFLRSPFPSSELFFFSEQEEFEALLRQEQAGLCHGAAVPGLGEGRAG